MLNISDIEKPICFFHNLQCIVISFTKLTVTANAWPSVATGQDSLHSEAHQAGGMIYTGRYQPSKKVAGSMIPQHRRYMVYVH